MVAYSFHPRFVDPILAGTKRQTIRGHRRRHARIGEEMQLYTGQRTQHCRLIMRATCLMVRDITIRMSADHGITEIVVDGAPEKDMDGFAVRDGFPAMVAERRDSLLALTPRENMTEFWLLHHAAPTFEGVLLEWGS